MLYYVPSFWFHYFCLLFHNQIYMYLCASITFIQYFAKRPSFLFWPPPLLTLNVLIHSRMKCAFVSFCWFFYVFLWFFFFHCSVKLCSKWNALFLLVSYMFKTLSINILIINFIQNLNVFKFKFNIFRSRFTLNKEIIEYNVKKNI